MVKEEKRFVRVYSDGIFGPNEIWVDRQTGVNYLVHVVSSGGGITPLLNRDGTPVVTPLPKEYTD